MQLLDTSTNTIFPYITSTEFIDVKTLFADGSWISLPNYNASWVDFGNILDTEEMVLPPYFGSVFTNKITYDFTTESSNVQYNEELTFDVRPNNVENNVKIMRSAYCLFESPYYDVSRVGKVMTGLTSGSTGILLTGNLGGEEPLTFTFSGSVSYISGTSANFDYNVYKYYPNYYNFLKPEVIRNSVDYTVYENSLFFYVNLDLTNYVDNEFLIKGGYTFSNCTPGAKLLGLKTSTMSINPLINYAEYDSKQDWYFAYILSALTPEVKSVVSLGQPNGVFKVESLIPQTLTNVYYPTASASGYYLVHINGVALERDVEYTSSLDSFTLLVSILSTDVLTVAYVADNLNGTAALVSSESYLVPSTIPNGTTISVGQKMLYNTSTNKYEYWLDSEASNNVIFLVNGIQQSSGEYIVSSSNKRRVILFFTPTFNDIIEVFYGAVVPGVQGIGGNTVEAVFTISIPPSKINGYFTVNFYDVTDITLSTPLFSETIDYIIGQGSYKTNILIPTTYSIGQQFLWRVTNTKNFKLEVTGDIITTVANSEVYNATLTSNQNNNY